MANALKHLECLEFEGKKTQSHNAKGSVKEEITAIELPSKPCDLYFHGAGFQLPTNWDQTSCWYYEHITT